jgi:peroxiredoxin
VHIVGVSFDPPADNAAWRADQSFPYELWTDDERILARALGAADTADAAYAQRVTVLLDGDGGVVKRWGVTDIGAHPAEVLEAARALVSP